MGKIYLYTGTGGGKTTNALGLALRCVGHEKRVVIIQFMKWFKETGEYKIKDRLAPYYEIYQFGREGWHGFAKLTDEDVKLSRKALEFAKNVLKKNPPHLLILDEINLAINCKLIDVKEVLELLDNIPEKTTVVLTGRYAPHELFERADYVNIIVDAKSPKDLEAREGIQF